MIGNKYMPFVLGVVAVCMVCAIYWNTGTLWTNHYDDSFVTYRYSINLAEHGQLVFNINEFTDAASSFLFTVVLAVFYKLGLHDLEWVSFVLNMIAIGLITAFVYLSGVKLGVNTLIAAVVSLEASVCGIVSACSVIGIETAVWTALLIVWTYYNLLTERKNLSTVLTILVVLMRHEGILVVPIWYVVNHIKPKVSHKAVCD